MALLAIVAIVEVLAPVAAKDGLYPANVYTPAAPLRLKNE
jgi:hypothetical protein